MKTPLVEHLASRRIENWPVTRKLAILFIARTKDALTVIAKMSGSGIRAAQHDFLFLRENGYAIRDPNNDRYHKLTNDGWAAADRATFLLAGELGLHVMEVRFDHWSEHTLRCCCGFSAHVNHRSKFSSACSGLLRQWHEHLADPEAWKRQRERVKAIIDSVGRDTTSTLQG